MAAAHNEHEMKAFQILNNVQRGKLLIDLFPYHIEAIVNSVKYKSEETLKREDSLRQQWENEAMTFDEYLLIVRDIAEVINLFGSILYRSKHVFADQLFYRDRAIVTNDCILEYATEGCGDVQFNMAVALFFCEEERDFTFFFKSQHSNN